MPDVSIVLPTYNGKAYLKQSVDSILKQDYTDWELILVDDCSTDGTDKIVDMYAAMDGRIRAIHNKENQKLPKSLNIGFAAARGKYLTWTSDDNLYLPDALALMVRRLEQHSDVYMVRCDMEIIDQAGMVTGKSGPYCDENMYICNCVGACFMYRRKVRDQIGDYNADAFCVEDYDYWLRVLQKYGRILPIDKILYQYRRHGGSLSEVRKKQAAEELTRLRIRFLDRIFEALRERPDELCKMYYDMKRSESMTQEAVKRFKKEIPELCGVLPVVENRKYIIFGAGAYGERAARQLGEKAVFFADNDMEKSGQIKCGLTILPFSEAVSMGKDYCFMIAIAKKHIYEMMAQLQKAGVKEYSVFT